MSAVKEALQRIEARAEWMKEHAEDMLELLKDAANVLSNYAEGEYFTDRASPVGNDAAKMEAEIVEFIAKVERIR